MSNVLSTKPKPSTAAQRTSEAIRKAAGKLGVKDLKWLGAALAEAAADGVERNTAFAAQVRALYESMVPPRPIKEPSRRRGGRAAPDVELVPIKQMDVFINPAAPPDPYFLLELYGPAQLPLALSRNTAPRLREAVKMVKERNPGTRPNGTNSAALIDYIVEHVAGASN